MSETVTIPTLSERIRPELWLRFGVAAVLGTAAVLKTIELSTSPVVQEGWLHSRELGMIAVNTELLMVCLLVSGVLPKLTWLGATAMFSVFSVVSGYLFLTGAESCNCFGRASVPPLYTTVFDLTVVGLLLLFRPKGWCEFRKEFFGLKKSAPFIAVFWLCLALPATYAIVSVQKNEVAELGTEFIGADGRKTILLEPEKWVGKEFPLFLRFADPRGSEILKQGEWNILLTQPGCPKCQEMRAEIEAKKITRTAVVVISSQLDEKAPAVSIPTFCLDNRNTWFATTPSVISISDGSCTKISECIDRSL
jgi:hypothetical protein